MWRLTVIQREVRGFGRLRKRLVQLRRQIRGSSDARSRFLFNRIAIGSYQVAASLETPSPLRTQDRPDLVRERTGFLLSTFRATFINQNTLRLQWRAPYAKEVNEEGYSKGYVQRTARTGRTRFGARLRQERRSIQRRLDRQG